MAQKDYVGRGRSTGTGRKKTSNSRSRKKRNSNSGVSKFMMALAVAVLVTFAGGLWFIAHHKKEEATVMPDRKTPGNGLPPKPEERWRYIKELENRQMTVPSPTEPSAGGDVHSQTQLTNEQRQLLEQMQADMKQQPTQLNEVPWNEQTPAQRQQTLQRQRLQNQLEMQSRMPAQAPAPHPSQPASHATTPPTTTQPKPQTQEKPKEPEKAKTQRWMVQCGSFKGTDQAESVRAQLAFEGFESRITTGGGWNRVVIGPYNSRSGVDSALKSLRGSGHTNCIPMAIGG
ncbi:cell division protein FtsN [Erwinia sp. OLTSP20]|uniref:cell division protein FtsN n=1 Tax=unclassified Erwinia TaxID=2622719 RepID=UPI000C1A76EF|nr:MULTISPECIES: cell division protein FtsN [unclassified Erwinia]PIJ49906.1 cell division protein FtsN [Erwinia sp. OAMSP11]PIJ71431.1 cell division protein FtsN [Erwinia sp. OLSSP12]PIJ80866.1 cell division protein FtsN [Erwinia sp. OLCASP19]PIJ83345.1 cell division protein FtsN [Erwinia sp. OLMTSP26]PIJ85567.1 cell division protein FtsN [Erwinia sp. OLMDSP33]